MSIHTTTSTKWVRGNLRILLATVLLAASVLSHADVLSGQVVSVSDGDTITAYSSDVDQSVQQRDQRVQLY